jgi:flavin reductase (DIM6/NTAB) family NADH-FMN oxidoreductase RutF
MMKPKSIIAALRALGASPRRITSGCAAIGKEALRRVTPAPELPAEKSAVSSFVKVTVFPVPAVICGAMVEGKPNFNVLGNFGIISPRRPDPIIYISSSRTHFTNKGIRENGAFSVNLISRSIMARADYLGVVSGKTTDKSRTMTVFYGKRSDAPCVAESPLSYVCRVIRHVEIDTMDMFIAEISETYVTRTFLQSDRIDIEAMEALLYTADGAYRIAGAPVGRAYSAYKDYQV